MPSFAESHIHYLGRRVPGAIAWRHVFEEDAIPSLGSDIAAGGVRMGASSFVGEFPRLSLTLLSPRAKV